MWRLQGIMWSSVRKLCNTWETKGWLMLGCYVWSYARAVQQLNRDAKLDLETWVFFTEAAASMVRNYAPVKRTYQQFFPKS